MLYIRNGSIERNIMLCSQVRIGSITLSSHALESNKNTIHFIDKKIFPVRGLSLICSVHPEAHNSNRLLSRNFLGFVSFTKLNMVTFKVNPLTFDKGASSSVVLNK